MNNEKCNCEATITQLQEQLEVQRLETQRYKQLWHMALDDKKSNIEAVKQFWEKLKESAETEHSYDIFPGGLRVDYDITTVDVEDGDELLDEMMKGLNYDDDC